MWVSQTDLASSGRRSTASVSRTGNRRPRQIPRGPQETVPRVGEAMPVGEDVEAHLGEFGVAVGLL
jgi:hypothetical protein